MNEVYRHVDLRSMEAALENCKSLVRLLHVRLLLLPLIYNIDTAYIYMQNRLAIQAAHCLIKHLCVALWRVERERAKYARISQAGSNYTAGARNPFCLLQLPPRLLLTIQCYMSVIYHRKQEIASSSYAAYYTHTRYSQPAAEPRAAACSQGVWCFLILLVPLCGRFK